MNLSESQKERFNELLYCIEIIFGEEKLGLMYSEIDEAWLISDVLRDLLLFPNPQIDTCDFYLKVMNEQSIYPWLSRLAENSIDFEIIGNGTFFNEKDVFQIIKLTFHTIGVDYPINIFTGSLDPKDFIKRVIPIGISSIGLDISDVFIHLSEKDDVEKLLSSIWKSPAYEKDEKNKKITLQKHSWMKNKESYQMLQEYLEDAHKKLEKLGFI